MEEVKVETGVDSLIALLEKKGKVSVKDAAQELKIGESYVQSWVDFLVEERILGVEYRFTKPYIFLNEKRKFEDVDESEDLDLTIDHFKKDFFDHAKRKLIPEDKIPQLWKLHLEEAIDRKKEYFLIEAAKRDVPDSTQLFEKYKQQLVDA